MTVRTRGMVLAIAAATLSALAFYLIYGAHAGWETMAILVPVGVCSVLLADALLARRARLGTLRRQLLVGGAIAVAPLLVVAGLFAALMTVTPEDALCIAVLACFAGVLGAWTARQTAGGVIADVDAIRGGLAAIAEGERDVAIAVRGNDELALVAQDIGALAARLGEEERARDNLERARRHLLAAVSHDLRTPITSLRLLADALDDDLVEPAQRREYLARIGTHVRALGTLIDDLFELSRLEAGDIRWTLEHVPLDDLVLETVEAMRPHAESCSVSVRAELARGVPAAHANPEQIQRVLFNLIQNALRHTPADGSVTVRAEPAGDTVEIEVADTGNGIAVGERERVFEAFVQGLAGSSGSAGLGLAISRAIVEAHGGRIWIADAPQGTAMRFSLPVVGAIEGG
jgi:signal transduction histidine kinase